MKSKPAAKSVKPAKPAADEGKKFANKMRKLLSLIPIIKSTPGIRLEQLAKISGIKSVKELSAELERLLMFGRPPFSPADYIDIYIKEDRVWLEFPQGLDRPLQLTPQEWVAVQNLLMKEIQFYAPGQKQSRELKAILQKMSQIPIQFGSDPAETRKKKVETAINHQNQIEFEYKRIYSADAELRRIDPWIVFIQRGTSYVLGHCHLRRDARIFHLDRMEKIRELDLKLAGPPAETGQILMKSYVFKPDQGGFSARVAFRINVESALARILSLEKVKKWNAPATRAGQESSAWKEAECRIHDSLWFKSVMRSFGSGVVILSPAHLRESYLAEIKEIAIPGKMLGTGKQ